MPDQENNTVIKHRYYPKLSNIITEEDIPDILGFLKDGIQQLLDDVHYKDLQYNKSPRGDAAFYSLSIVSKRLGIELPGTGISLIINPDATDTRISAFPITIDYEWKILAFLRGFDLSSFSFTPQEFFEIALRVLNISEEQALANFVNTFTVPGDENTTALEQFVTDLNDANAEINLLPPDGEATLTDIATEIYNQSQKYSTLIAFGTYIAANDVDTATEKLREFFRQLLPEDIEEYIKDILLPKIRATLTLSAGIEFPRSVLKPVYDEFGKNPHDSQDTGTYEALAPIPTNPDGGDPKVLLTFGEALFYADTQEGFGYNLDLAINTNAPAQIGNTGLIVDIRNLKVDLSRNTNIIEADQDNRPPEFMGVYTDLTTVYLPKKWFKKDTNQTLAISAEKMLIGTGGMSGTIALRATYAQEGDTVTNYFKDYFDIVYPVTVISNGTEEQIDNYETGLPNSLLDHISALDNPKQPKFKYPFSVTSGSTTTTFENETQYNNYISAIDPNKFMWFSLGSDPAKAWRLGFNRFDLTFHHGQVVESNLLAQLEIPKLRTPDTPAGEVSKIGLQGHWNNEDDFNLTASFLSDGGLDFTLFNFVTINVLTAELGREEGDFYIGTSCEISFENETMNKVFDGQTISIPKLRIYQDGSIEIVGGTGFLPVNISMNLGPIEVAVTGVHFGSHQQEDDQGNMRRYNYWGFDGAISLDPLGLDARGEGIKYYYTVDNEEFGYGDDFLRIQTIEVDLIIPGNATADSAMAIINGMLSIPDPGESPEYRGSVSLKFPKARIAGGGVAMRLQPRHPAFLLDAHLEIPVPIPIGPSLGINEFRGLLGYRYVAEKEAVGLVSGEDTWYDYYTYPPKGIDESKFSGPERTAQYGFPFSIGAGATIGTLFDRGNTLSVRAMMLLSLPTLFLVEGRASILASQLKLDDDREPPFFAFVAWGDNSIEMGMGADFELPNIIKIYAEVQAGFFFNGQKNWYVNFGTKENPITATIFPRILSITAKSYLMLSAQGIEAGARVEVDFKKRFGPARVRIYAYLEMGGFVSFERPQIGGYVALGGEISIRIWVVGITIGLDAILSVEAAKPFLIYAELSIRVCIRIIVRICKRFTVRLRWERSKTVDTNPIPPLPYTDSTNSIDRTQELVKGIHMLNNETFDIDFIGVMDNDDEYDPSPSLISKVIPLDTFIDIKTVKGLNPSSDAVRQKIGGHTGGADNFIDLIPPQKVVRGGREIRQVKHKYSIEAINIKARVGNSWVDYHPFEAVVEDGDRHLVDHLRIGYWQRDGNQYDAIRLLATDPFSYTQAGEPGWTIPEQYGITPSELFCVSEALTEDCANVLNKPLGTRYYNPTQFVGHFINGAYFRLDGEAHINAIIDANGNQTISTTNEYFEVTDVANAHGKAKSMQFDNDQHLVAILPEPSTRIVSELTTYAEGVYIEYYKSAGIVDFNPTYEMVLSEYKTAAELASQVIYENDNEPISKVIYKPVPLNHDQIQSVQQQIADLYDLIYDNTTGNTVDYTTYETQLNDLYAELDQLVAESCASSTDYNPFTDDDCGPCSVLAKLKFHQTVCYQLDETTATMQELIDDTPCLEDVLNLINCVETGYPIEIGQATCANSENQVIWSTVYIENNTPTIDTGITVWSDLNLTNAYQGGSNEYRVRIDGSFQAYTVRIDNSGLVYDKQICITGPGNNGEPTQDDSNSCERRFTGTFTAGASDQVQVTFHKTGTFGYGVTINGSTTLSSDGQTTTVTGPVSYDTGSMPNVYPIKTMGISFVNLTTSESSQVFDISPENTNSPC